MDEFGGQGLREGLLDVAYCMLYSVSCIFRAFDERDLYFLGGKHHSTRSMVTGNPAFWAAWEDESLNRTLATLARSAHSSRLEEDVLAKFSASGSGGAKAAKRLRLQ